MLTITEAQLQAWMATYVWPFVRIAAFFTVAPIFGARFVPARIRMGLGELGKGVRDVHIHG